MYERTGNLVREKFREHLLPTMLTTMAISLASVVDGVIVGQLLGDSALAAIGLCGPVIFCINIIFILFSVGGMTSASIARGKQQTEHANRLFTTTIAAGFAMMLVFLIVMQAILLPVCRLIAAGDAEIERLAVEYLHSLLFTGPLLMLASGTALFMRADGRPKSSALVVIIANAVNLALDYVLIRFLDTGIMGAGLSTSLGYGVGVLVVLPYLLNAKQQRSFRFVPVRSIGKHLLGILKLGLPKGLTSMASLVQALVLNTLVMTFYGSAGMAVMTVLINVLMICNIFIGGTGDTLLPIVGTLYGEGDLYGVRKTVASARNALLVVCTLLVAFFMIFPQVMAWMFGLNAPDAKQLLSPALRMFALYIPLYATVITLQNFYNTTGREKFAVWISLLGGSVFICCFALLLGYAYHPVLWLCYACGSAATLVTILAAGVRIRRREKVEGLLLIQNTEGYTPVWDITLTSTRQDAVGLSEEVIRLCGTHNMAPSLANHIGVAIEEMALAVAHYAHGDQAKRIDVMISEGDGEILIRFRDNGIPFNPVEFTPEGEGGPVTNEIELMKALVDGIHYSRQLGFNTTTLRFSREK